MPATLKEPAPPPASTRLRRRWAEADHDARQRLIIEASLTLLDRHGLDAVTMRRVAQRLGIGTMTLYTYFHGQDDLRLAMTRRGFEMLQEGCRAADTLDTPEGWRGGARHYVRFARENPRLYELMFATPMPHGSAEDQLLHSGFEGLLSRVRERIARRGLAGQELERRARAASGRYWIALHGLASLAIAGRLVVLHRPIDQLLDELLEAVAPD